MAPYLSRAGDSFNLGLGEVEDAGRAEHHAVDGERSKGPGLEVAHEEAHRQVGGDSGDDDSHEDLAVDVGAGRAGEGRELEYPGGQDGGGGQQEPEAGCVFVVEAPPQAADDRGAGPADAGEQGRDLQGPDEEGVEERQPGDAGIGSLGWRRPRSAVGPGRVARRLACLAVRLEW